jgi:hypothetical protein
VQRRYGGGVRRIYAAAMARIAAYTESLNIGFPGGTYDQPFYVAGVRIARVSIAICTLPLENTSLR